MTAPRGTYRQGRVRRRARAGSPDGSATPGAPPARAVSARLLVCRLKVPLPSGVWVQQFSKAHPEVRVEIRNRLDLGRGRTLTEVGIRASEGSPWYEEIRRLPGVDRVDLIESENEGREVVLRVTHRTSSFIPLFRATQLLRRFPFPVEDGEATWVVVGPEPSVRRLVEELRARAPGMVVESVRHQAGGRSGPLTSRQEEIFHRAMAAGYFDVPRKVTLTELAETLGMAISSLSESLAIIERKLLESYTMG